MPKRCWRNTLLKVYSRRLLEGDTRIHDNTFQSCAATEMFTMEEDTLDFVKQGSPCTPLQMSVHVWDWIETHRVCPPNIGRSLSLHIKEAANRHSLQCEGVVSMYTGEASSEMVDYCLRRTGHPFPLSTRDYMKIASLRYHWRRKRQCWQKWIWSAGANLLWDREIPDPGWRTPIYSTAFAEVVLRKKSSRYSRKSSLSLIYAASQIEKDLSP